MKISSVGVELFHTDGRTYITRLIVAFRNISNAPKKNAFTQDLFSKEQLYMLGCVPECVFVATVNFARDICY